MRQVRRVSLFASSKRRRGQNLMEGLFADELFRLCAVKRQGKLARRSDPHPLKSRAIPKVRPKTRTTAPRSSAMALTKHLKGRQDSKVESRLLEELAKAPQTVPASTDEPRMSFETSPRSTEAFLGTPTATKGSSKSSTRRDRW